MPAKNEDQFDYKLAVKLMHRYAGSYIQKNLHQRLNNRACKWCILHCYILYCVQSVVNKCMREPTFVLFKQQKRQRRKRKKSCIQYALSSEIVDLKIHKANSLGYTEIKNRHPGSSNDSKFKTALNISRS